MSFRSVQSTALGTDNAAQEHSSVVAARLHPGDRIADRYLILETLGEGGFGVVYLALQESVQRYVALKTLKPRSLKGEVAERVMQGFHREALHTSRLGHPNTITLFDYGQTEIGQLYLVTEFLDGDTLASWQARRRHWPPSLVLHIITQVAQSLAEAHNLGIVHGDLKPDNIFLCDTWGDSHFVKVLDFGIGRMIGDANPAGMGTPSFMSPEQFVGDPLGPASDIYALGLVAHELLTGIESSSLFRTSFAGVVPIREPDWSCLPIALARVGWGDLLQRATAEEPADRYADGAAFLEALQGLKGKFESLEETTTLHAVPPLESGLSPQSLDTQQGPLGFYTQSMDSSQEHAWAASMDDTTHADLVLHVADRASLLGLLQQARQERQGRVVLLGGERGLGKTVCARWLMEQGQTLGLCAGMASCDPKEPLQGLAEAFARAIGCGRDVNGARSMQVLEERVQSLLGRFLLPSEMVLLLCVYGWANGISQEDVAEGFANLLCQVANANPMLLVLRDLEDADPLTIACIEHLVLLLEEAPCSLMVLGTLCRDLLPERREVVSMLGGMQGRASLVSHSLERLPQPEQLSLLREVMAEALAEHEVDAGPSAELLGLLLRLGHGNPRALQELSRYVVGRDLLVPTSHGLVLRREIDARHLMPPKLSSFLEQRLLARLSRHAREASALKLLVLRCALLGPSFPQGLLGKLLSLESSSGHPCVRQIQEQLGDLLKIMIREDILVQEEGHGDGLRWVFAQPLMHGLLAKRVDHLPDAAVLHRLTAMVKIGWYEAHHTLALHRREIALHEDRAAKPGGGQTPAGWDDHRSCWRHDLA